MARIPPALWFLLLFALAACGGGVDKGDSLITVTLVRPGAAAGGATFTRDLLQAFEEEGAGRILAVREKEHVVEISMRIRELADINRIKKAIIRVDPGTEYRIEHN